jgi:hypothetical protein
VYTDVQSAIINIAADVIRTQTVVVGHHAFV